MVTISASVGQRGMNLPVDVMTVESLLLNHRRWLDPLPHMVPDGNFAPETLAAIRRFQETACALAKEKVDGAISPRGFTFSRLALGYIPYPKSPAFWQMSWRRELGELKVASGDLMINTILTTPMQPEKSCSSLGNATSGEVALQSNVIIRTFILNSFFAALLFCLCG